MLSTKQKLLAEQAEREQKEVKKNQSVREDVKTINVEEFKRELQVKTLTNVKFSTSDKKQAVKATEKPGVLSIIYSIRNGKRYLIANSMYKRLDEPKTLQVGFTDTNILFSEMLNENATDYDVRYSQNRPVIYSSDLVIEAIIKFDLDYPEGCVSKTFNDVRYYIDSETNKTVAEVRIISDEIALQKEVSDEA